MRAGCFVVLSLLGLVLAASSANASDQASPYRWCALYGSPNNESCHFVTLEKCRNFIAISGGACFPNVYFKEGTSNSSNPSNPATTVGRSTRS